MLGVSLARPKRNVPLPPGPTQDEIIPGKPYVHIFCPTPSFAYHPVRTYLQFHEFGQRYSPVFSVTIGKELFIIITGYKVSIDCSVIHLFG